MDTFSGEWLALWPQPDLLVWRSALNYYLPLLYAGPAAGGVVTFTGDATAVPVFGAGFAPGGSISFWPWWGWGSPSRLIAFDVSTASEPILVSDLSLQQTQLWGGSTSAFATDGLVYSSHRDYESVVTGTNYYVYTNTVTDFVTNIVTVTNISHLAKYVTVTNYEFVTNLTTGVLNRPDGLVSWLWPQPTPLAGVLSSGYHHSLLADAAGSAWAWGAN